MRKGSSVPDILRVASASGFKRADVEAAIREIARKRKITRIVALLIILAVLSAVASVSFLLYSYYNPSVNVPLSSFNVSGGSMKKGVLYFEKQGLIKAGLNLDFTPERVVLVAKGSPCFSDVADIFKYNGRNYVYVPVASKPVVKDGKVDFAPLSFEEAESAKSRYGWPTLSFSLDSSFIGKIPVNSGKYKEYIFEVSNVNEGGNKGKFFKVLMLRTNQFCEGRKLWIKEIKVEGRR